MEVVVTACVARPTWWFPRVHEWVAPYPLLGARSLTTPFAPVVTGGFLVHANPGTVHALDWPYNFSRVDSLFIQSNLLLERSPVVAR